MAKQRLTDRQLISGITLTDLLHFVITGDTSQNPAGSSYKGTVTQLFDAFSSYTCSNPLIVDTVNACDSGITINGNVTINGSATTINTEVIQSKDNNIILNYSGNHTTALWGGITVEDGQSDGVDSLLYIDADGCWHADPGFCDLTVDGMPFTAQTPYLFVDDGSVNSITTRYTGNSITNSDYSNIGGGKDNTIDPGSDYSNIAGGLNNLIDDYTRYSVIGGGNSNQILGGEGYFNSNAIVGGERNAIDVSYFSNIAGGSGNTIDSSYYSSVGGGKGNQILNSDYSAILGGRNNILTNHNDTHIIGSNITSVSANTTHVERFNIGTIDNNESLNDVLVRDTDGTVRYRSSQSIADSFTGNTSGTCITDLFVTNLYGCSPLHIEPSGENDVYIVENGGNVGVGTTSPTEKLDISGKTKTTNFQMTSGATSGYVLTSDVDGNASWQLPLVATDLGNILFVSTNGDDSTAVKGDLHKPWENIYAAKSASTSGDTIYVLPGSWVYDNRNTTGNQLNGQIETKVNLWKNGITYYFSPGSKIIFYNQTSTGQIMYLFNPLNTGGET